MKTRTSFLILILALLLPANINAQFGGVLKKTLNKALNKEIGHQVDTAVNKSIKSSGNNENGQNNQNSNSNAQEGQGTLATGRGLFGGKIDIKYNEEYLFTGRIYMQMETYEKKDVMKSDYYTFFSGNSPNAAIEVQIQNSKEKGSTMPSVFLFDGDNRCFMMLINNGESKTGIISNIPSDSSMASMTKNQKGEKSLKPTITKTGNTRMIAGYNCDEYKVAEEGKENYSLIWLTKDLKIKADRKYWGKAGMPSYYGDPALEGAIMLGMESFDKNNQPAMKMETKEINESYSHSVSTAGYTFMKMNFGQAGKTK